MTVKFVATGDALFSSRNLKERLPEEIITLFRKADVAFTNAEFTTPEPQRPVAAGRGYVTSVRPDILKELSDLNLRYVSFANNHSGDFGLEGMQDTLDAAGRYGLHALGLAPSLYEARAPHFYDGKRDRLAIITIDITRSEVFIASDAGNGVPARPGVNALRFESHYVLPENAFETLSKIDERLGTRASMLHGSKIETFSIDTETSFRFGSLFEKNIIIEKGEDFQVKTVANQWDQSEILRRIVDAKKRADYVVVNYHTHEGKEEDWYHDYAADFVESFSHLAIEAGADLIFGHGAHMFRGVEIYQEKPILYNLGSLLIEFEAGESIVPPEMYQAYGYKSDSLPSDLHGNRAKNKQGEFIGFNSSPIFSWNLIADIEFGDQISFRFLPIHNQLQSERVASRGIPRLATIDEQEQIIQRLNDISQRYGTTFVLKDGWIKLENIY